MFCFTFELKNKIFLKKRKTEKKKIRLLDAGSRANLLWFSRSNTWSVASPKFELFPWRVSDFSDPPQVTRSSIEKCFWVQWEVTVAFSSVCFGRFLFSSEILLRLGGGGGVEGLRGGGGGGGLLSHSSKILLRYLSYQTIPTTTSS